VRSGDDRRHLGEKLTDQNGVADDQKSVARQVDHARDDAVRKAISADKS